VVVRPRARACAKGGFGSSDNTADWAVVSLLMHVCAGRGPLSEPVVARVFLLQCVAVCCSMLQCVAVCCSVLQCVVYCSVLQCVAAVIHTRVCRAMPIGWASRSGRTHSASVVQSVVECFIVLQCVAVCCSVS